MTRSRRGGGLHRISCHWNCRGIDHLGAAVDALGLIARGRVGVLIARRSRRNLYKSPASPCGPRHGSSRSHPARAARCAAARRPSRPAPPPPGHRAPRRDSGRLRPTSSAPCGSRSFLMGCFLPGRFLRLFRRGGQPGAGAFDSRFFHESVRAWECSPVLSRKRQKERSMSANSSPAAVSFRHGREAFFEPRVHQQFPLHILLARQHEIRPARDAN